MDAYLDCTPHRRRFKPSGTAPIPDPVPGLAGAGLLLNGRGQEQVFWDAAGVAAVLYLLAGGALLGRADVACVSGGPHFYVLGLPTILLYSLLAAYVFRRCGFLAALLLRLGFFFVWHILYALP